MVAEIFLLKVKEGEIFGFINGRIIDEVFHKLLMAQISNKYKIKLRDALTYTNVNPEVLKKFQTPTSIIEDILDFDGIKILEIDKKIVSQAIEFSDRLLFSDAIHVSCCKVYGIRNIATNDSDFERVPFLDIWKPQPPNKNFVDKEGKL